METEPAELVLRKLAQAGFTKPVGAPLPRRPAQRILETDSQLLREAYTTHTGVERGTDQVTIVTRPPGCAGGPPQNTRDSCKKRMEFMTKAKRRETIRSSHRHTEIT